MSRRHSWLMHLPFIAGLCFLCCRISTGDEAAPGAYLPLGIIYDGDGKELTRVAPRLVSVNNTAGY